LFFLLIVYPLSTGPAAWLEIMVPSAKHAIEAFYSPLVFLCAHCPPANKAFIWYVVVLWRVPLG
jgi:hypothetical protein